MTRILSLFSFLGLLLLPFAASAAAELVCNTFDEIHCGSEYNDIVVKCYDGDGLQIDCNADNLEAKCEEAKKQQIHPGPFSDDHGGVVCKSGKLIGCFTVPPVPDMTCGTPLDETNLVSCSMTQAQMQAVCISTGGVVPMLPTGAAIALFGALLGAARWRARPGAST